MSNMKVGVFGSAFNPPTCGHLDVLMQVAHLYDKVLLVPSASHAFSKKMLPFDSRIEMLNVFIKSICFGLCKFEVCCIEGVLFNSKKGGERLVYTFDVMEALELFYGDNVELSFIRGPDNADPQVWKRFYKEKELEERWFIYTVEERIHIRSSLVREVIAGGGMEKQGGSVVKKLLTPCVYDYIKVKRLYLKVKL